MFRTIKGDLGLMSLADLLSWVEGSSVDGSLIISQDGVSKYFFFQQGALIYFTSKNEQERLGNFLVAETLLTRQQLERSMAESTRLAIPFVAHIIAEKYITADTLQQVMLQLLQKAISESLEWDKGRFEFKETIPQPVLNGPIKLNITQLLFRSSVQYDEELATDQKRIARIKEDFLRKIKAGAIVLPPTPAMIGKLQQLADDNDFPLAEAAKIVEADPMLTSKILKVVNSPFFNLSGAVSSIQHAVTILGFSALKSVAVAHSMEQMNKANIEKIKPIMQHSLEVACIAKKLASHVGLDPEELFVCGILHDIGKTLLIHFLSTYDLPPEQREKAIGSLHPHAGHLLAQSWGFSEITMETIRYHHAPAKAAKHPQAALLVQVADKLARTEHPLELLEPLSKIFQAGPEKLTPFLMEIQELKREQQLP